MGTVQRRILVVAQSLPLANALLTWLSDAGYEVVLVTSFGAAKAHLKTGPDLVITELKLRDYNGLHLALRAREDHIPTVVIGPADRVLEQDARQLGATYILDEGLVREDILRVISNLLPSVNSPLSSTDELTAEQSLPEVGQIVWRESPQTWTSSAPGSQRRPTLH